MGRAETVVDVEGRRLRMTNLDKVFYPQTGTTKAQVAQYYAEVAEVLVPHCAGRPVTRKRWVDGVGTARRPLDSFFSKDLDAGTPTWVVRADVQHSDHVSTYPVVDSRATLAWFAQIAALELHLPQWRLDPQGQPDNPDRLVLDLDPGPGVELPMVAQVAELVREILAGMDMECYPVTSGSKGIHLYAPLPGSVTSAQASALAKELARSLEADHPQVVLSRMKRSERAGKVFLDWSQNNAKKTTVAPYSLRGTALPKVAAPRTWEELADPDLQQVSPEQVLELLAQRGDPMAALGVAPQMATPDRLARYRAKRDATRTPEPVPGARSEADDDGGQRQSDGVEAGLPEPDRTQVEQAAPDQPTFVIQEHHASRLHWDFRLEHHGVLVSWALPKGVPTSPERNNLAVPTEDHPLEYATFSGTIPAGEYGAGVVSIWDQGTYEAEKWREGAEVIAVLTGAENGGLANAGLGRRARFALIRTGGEREQWLIRLMKRQPDDDATHPGQDRQPEESDPHPASEAPHAPASPAPASSAEGSTSTASRAVSSSLSKPTRYAPMLAAIGRASDVDGPQWSVEMKWDGVRALVYVEDGQVRVFGRSGRESTEQYPEVQVMADLVHAGSAVLDGEIVALDSRGRPDFGRLQPRMQASGQQVAAAVRRQGVHLMLFDLLTLDGHDLTGFPYRQRRDLLAEAVSEAATVQVPPAFSGDVASALAASAEQGLEGVVAKQVESRYQPGRRSSSWIKIRHARTQEVVVAGWRPGQGSRSGAVGSLLLGVPDESGRWRYAGRVGTGFSQRAAQEWLQQLQQMERATPAVDEVPALDAREAHWVEPALVAEVSFAHWTRDGRLRHPVWRGWRVDKEPAEIRLED